MRSQGDEDGMTDQNATHIQTPFSFVRERCIGAGSFPFVLAVIYQKSGVSTSARFLSYVGRNDTLVRQWRRYFNSRHVINEPVSGSIVLYYSLQGHALWIRYHTMRPFPTYSVKATMTPTPPAPSHSLIHR